MSAFDRLLEQIDAFIRKYYKNEMLKGALVFTGFLLLSWLLVTGLEFVGRFSSSVRFLLLMIFLAGNAIILAKYFVLPFMRLNSFGKRINRKQAASIIGSFFPNVSDRLLNTLQLSEVNNPDDRSYELLRASVVQRSKEFSAIPFVDAVRYQESKRYLRYLIPIALAFLAIGLFVPAWLVDASSSVVNYDQKQPAPFSFTLVSGNRTYDEGQSVVIEADITGQYVPEKVYIVSDRGKFLTTKTRKNRVSYTFENLKSSTGFHFESEDVESGNFMISVIGKSSMGSLTAVLHFPAYLNRKPETVRNVADLDLPEGTTVQWNVAARNVSKVDVKWSDSVARFDSAEFSFSRKYKSSGPLRFVLTNAVTNKKDTSTVQIKVVKDAYPAILVNEAVDSVSSSIRSFEGMLSDDYGLTGLKFNYSIQGEDGRERKNSLSVKKVTGVADKFVFTVDFSREKLAVNDKISYYFSVTDNDGVNGPKTTRSQMFVYELPSLGELNEKRDEVQKDVQNALQDMLKRADKFQRDVNRLQKSVNSQQKADFKTLEQVQQLQIEQQQLQQEMQAIQEKLEQSNDEKNQLSEQDEELMKQQEMIEELMKEVMDDELKKLLEDLEEMLRKNDQNQFKQETQQLDQSTEEMKKQLDRTLESLKRLQVNEKIDDLEKELNELADEQEKLQKDISEKKLSDQNAKQKQDELNKKFDEIRDDMNELKKLNEELERPMQLGDFKEEQEAIGQQMQEAKEQLEKGKPSKAGEQQKGAAGDMREMAEKMDQQQEQSNQKQNAEDMGLLRMLLENLMSLSFSQEDNLQSFTKVKDADPAYRKFGRRQRSIIDDTKVVEDSLMALAKRQPKIATFVDKELKEINTNFRLIVNEIDEHERRQLGQHQQLVMTSYNNLALLLNESLQSMQQEAQSQQKGSGSCDNPGGTGKKPSSGQSMSPGDMKQMLQQQLEQMKKGMNPGGKQPGQKPGQQGMPGQGTQGMQGLGNQQIAKMAAQQTAIRQRLEQLRNELNKEGKGKGNQLSPLIQELEKQEKDLINKQFSPEMIRRQQDIMTRLLESEKAIRERGFEEKRESQQGKDKNYGNLIRFDEYNRQKLGQVELMRSVDPMLSQYYKMKAGEYFNKAQ
jgi:hypothetical protein